MGVAWLAWMSLVSVAAGSAVQPVLDAFPLSAVVLTPGSQEADAAELNADFLRMIDIEDMLWTFRQNAGLQPVAGSHPFFGVRNVPATLYACLATGRQSVICNPAVIAELGRSVSGGARAVYWPLPQRNCTVVQPHR